MTKLKTGNFLDFSLLLLVAIVWGTSYGVAKTACLVLALVMNFKITIQLPQSSTFWLTMSDLVIFVLSLLYLCKTV